MSLLSCQMPSPSPTKEGALTDRNTVRNQLEGGNSNQDARESSGSRLLMERYSTQMFRSSQSMAGYTSVLQHGAQQSQVRKLPSNMKSRHASATAISVSSSDC